MADIKFAEKDAATLENILKVAYETIMRTTYRAGDPMDDFIKWIAYVIQLENENIDFTGKMNLLRYAIGLYLETLGEITGTARIEAQGAQSTIKYTFSKIFPEIVTIPKGHKVGAGNLYFELNNDVQLGIGQREVYGVVTCTTLGVAGNDLQVGEINSIIDDIPYLETVSNVTVSAGGVEEESDEHLRERIRLRPFSFSVAGPVNAYLYWVKTAHQGIVDSYIYTPITIPGVVRIVPLMENGQLPSEEIKAQILEVVNDDYIRPFTDSVSVDSPENQYYNIDVDYYIYKDADDTVIKENVAKATQEYIAWQKAVLGRDINPDKLTQLLVTAGAKRVVIREPQYAVTPPTHVATEGTVSVNYIGEEDE